MTILEKLLLHLAQWRKVTFTCALFLIAALAAFWPQLTIDDSPEHWIPSHSLDKWQRFCSHFRAGDTIAIGMQFHREIHDSDIEHIAQLRTALLGIAGIQQVYDLALVTKEIERVPLTTILHSDNTDRFSLYRGALFDGVQQGLKDRTLVTLCELKQFPNNRRTQERRNAVENILHVLNVHRKQNHPTFSEISFHVAGGLILQRKLEQIAKEMLIGPFAKGTSFKHNLTASFKRPPLLPLCLIILLVIFGLIYRSMTSIIVVVFGIAWAISILVSGIAASQIPLNVITVAGPTLMTVIGLATAIHFAHFHSVHHKTDTTSLIHWVAVPCVGAALTTGTGFLMLSFNELKPVRELGLELFIGALLAFLGIFLANLAVPLRSTASGHIFSSANLHYTALQLTKRPYFWLFTSVTLVAFLSYGGTHIYVDADPFSFFKPNSPTARALRHFSQEKFGLYPLEIAFLPTQETRVPLKTIPDNISFAKQRVRYDKNTKELVSNGVLSPSAVSALLTQHTNPEWVKAIGQLQKESQQWKDDPQVRQQISDFLQTISDRPEFLKAISTVSFETRSSLFQSHLSRLAQSNPIEAAQEIAQLLKQASVFQKSFVSWSTDQQQTGALRVTLLVHDPGTGFAPFVEAVHQSVPDDGVETIITGAVSTVVTLSKNLISGITLGIVTSIICMTVLCGILFGSLRLALIATIPNFFPLIFVFGIMGLSCWLNFPGYVIPVNSGSAMVATIALGIALNDTIHFVVHYRLQKRDPNKQVQDAIAVTFQHVGRPILLTSLIHMIGFSIFLFSDFQPLVHFGFLSMLSMIAALFGDLILLPNLLLLFDRSRN